MVAQLNERRIMMTDPNGNASNSNQSSENDDGWENAWGTTAGQQEVSAEADSCFPASSFTTDTFGSFGCD